MNVIWGSAGCYDVLALVGNKRTIDNRYLFQSALSFADSCVSVFIFLGLREICFHGDVSTGKLLARSRRNVSIFAAVGLPVDILVFLQICSPEQRVVILSRRRSVHTRDSPLAIVFALYSVSSGNGPIFFNVLAPLAMTAFVNSDTFRRGARTT